MYDITTTIFFTCPTMVVVVGELTVSHFKKIFVQKKKKIFFQKKGNRRFHLLYIRTLNTEEMRPPSHLRKNLSKTESKTDGNG